MKTSILQLEPYDDIISTRDKMGWSKSARILLVWPLRGRILRRRVDLVLLQRRGQELGSQIALVTRDGMVGLYARELGIPVFVNVKQAEMQPWRARPRRRVYHYTHRPPANPVELRQRYTDFHRLPDGILEHPVTRFFVFLAAVLSVAGLVLFFLPSARVELAPMVQQQSITLAVRANPSITAVSATGSLPAQVSSVVVEGQAEQPTSGRTQIADAFASGVVQLSNLTDREVPVPAGTVVRTDGSPPARFETTAAVTVPSGPGQSADVTVKALLPGPDSNVDAGEISSMEGELGLVISASNAQALSGGSQRSVRAPSATDETTLRAQLLATLRENALKDLQRSVGAEGEVLPVSLLISKVLSEERTPPDNQPADRLQLKMQVEYSAWSVRALDLNAVGLAALSVNLPEGFQPVADSLKVEPFTQPQMAADGQEARWQIRASGQIRATWTPDQVAALALGKTPADAEAIIAQQVALQSPPRITLRPAWWVRMPYLAFRIQVVTP